MLPSGKEVEVVSFEGSKAFETNPLYPLEHCHRCKQDLCYPTAWAEIEDDQWQLWLRCPNCENCPKITATHEEVERYDEILNQGTDALIDQTEQLSQHNFACWADDFIEAINNDAIWPEDFQI